MDILHVHFVAYRGILLWPDGVTQRVICYAIVRSIYIAKRNGTMGSIEIEFSNHSMVGERNNTDFLQQHHWNTQPISVDAFHCILRYQLIQCLVLFNISAKKNTALAAYFTFLFRPSPLQSNKHTSEWIFSMLRINLDCNFLVQQ